MSGAKIVASTDENLKGDSMSTFTTTQLHSTIDYHGSQAYYYEMTLMLMMMGGECKEGCDRRQADVARCQQRFPAPLPPYPPPSAYSHHSFIS